MAPGPSSPAGWFAWIVLAKGRSWLRLLDLALGASRMLVEPGRSLRLWRRLMDLMTIGAFAERTRLSPGALRLYDRLGLLPPVRTAKRTATPGTPVCDLSVPLR